MEKYKLKISDLERIGGAVRLERDGYNREKVIKEMYKITDGATTRERQDIISKLYDREKG